MFWCQSDRHALKDRETPRATDDAPDHGTRAVQEAETQTVPTSVRFKPSRSMSQFIAALSAQWHTPSEFINLVDKMREYCLVLVQSGIVAKDIAATLEERCLGVPLISQCEEDALQMIMQLDKAAVLRMAVIQGDRALISQGELYRALTSAACPVIWVQDTANPASDGQDQVLTLPFFTDDLEQTLDRAGLNS